MISKHLKAVLDRVANWPEERQQQLADLALEIERELTGAAYQASADELQAIDEGLSGDAANEEEINAAYATFRRP